MKSSYITATDKFCGAGGSTTGAVEAGVEVKMALNHWKLAIETHNTNHPNTDHHCTDIQASEPRWYPSTTILYSSPECTNHTHSNGKKKRKSQLDMFDAPINDPSAERSRATMWDVVRFTEYHKYEVCIVENVVEARKWVLFDAWRTAMDNLGYNHRCLYLNSMFFNPCPQSRDRMYVVFYKKGNKEPDLDYRPLGHCSDCGEKEMYQWWKNPQKKWGKYGKNGQYLYRCSGCNEVCTPYYYASFNCIDWSIPGQRIGDRKKKLADNTIKRIEYGLEKYSNRLLCITNGYSSGLECRVRGVDQAIGTQVGNVKHSVLIPYLTSAEQSSHMRVRPMDQATFTQTTTQSSGVVVPFIIDMKKNGGARSVGEKIMTVAASGNHHMLIGNYSPGWARGLEKVFGSITTSDSHALLRAPFITSNYGQGKANESSDALGTVTTVQNHGILSVSKFDAFLQAYYGSGISTRSLGDPVNVISTIDRMGLISEMQPKVEDCYYRMLLPHEIQGAMAFPDDYIILGNSKQKVKQLGNAVTPPVMKWITKRVIKSLE